MRNFCAVIKWGKKIQIQEKNFRLLNFCFWFVCERLLIRSLETVFILVDTETHISENFLILVLHQNKGNLELQKKKILNPYDRKEFWIYFTVSRNVIKSDLFDNSFVIYSFLFKDQYSLLYHVQPRLFKAAFIFKPSELLPETVLDNFEQTAVRYSQ